MSVTLCPFDSADSDRVARFRVHPDQIRFSGTPAEALKHAETNPEIDAHLILDAGTPVGLFKIDRAYADVHPFAASRGLGLRAFMIDIDSQGRGLAQAAVRAMPSYLRLHYPWTPAVFLTVNMANTAAIRAYLRGGFQDTGKIWPHGDAGPQHIMRMAF